MHFSSGPYHCSPFLAIRVPASGVISMFANSAILWTRTAPCSHAYAVNTRHHAGFPQRGWKPSHTSSDGNQSARRRSAWPTDGGFIGRFAAAYPVSLTLVGFFVAVCPRLQPSLDNVHL